LTMQGQLLPDNYRTRFFSSLFRHKVLVLACFLVAFGLFIFFAAGMNLKEDIMDLLPSHDPVVKRYKAVLTSFHSFDYMLIDVGPENDGRVPSIDELVRAADTLVEKMSASNYFSDIQYRLVADDMMSSFGVLKRHRASLFTEEDERELEERLRRESLRETFRGWKRLLTESPAPFLAESFYNDPLALDTILLKKLNDLKSMGGEVKMDEGRVFSKDMMHIF